MSKSWVSRYLFEKVENPFGATIVTYFWCFGNRICAILDQKSIIFWIKLGFSCLASLRRPREDLYIAQEGFLEASWLQDASILVQNARKKAFFSEEKSSSRQVGPKSAPEGPRSLSQTLLGGSWGPPGVNQETRGVPGGLRDAKMTSKSAQNDPKSTSKWLQKQPQMTTKRTYQHLNFHLFISKM